MKSNSIYCFIGVMLFTIGCSCKKDPIVSQNQILIKNPSFESNGQPTAENWFFAGGVEGDTSTSLSQDTPPRGGNWSLILQGEGNALPSYAETYITGISGKKIYDFNIFMKIVGSPYGSASLKVISQNQILYTNSVSADTSAWKLYSLKDTIYTKINDTIIVKLSSGGAGPLGGNVLFDLVELKTNKL